MKNLLKLKYYFLFFFASLLVMSCDEDDPEPGFPPAGTEGFFIVNEGAWGNGNASLSFFDRESGTVTNDLFYSANNQTPLGDQAQSMAIHDTLGYIVVQNSGKIEVIGINSYQSVATIDEGIPSPRYFVGYSATKGFVSDWGVDGVSGTVKVIDLSNFSVTNTIETGQGANKMLIDNGRLFVTHSGGWGRDNQVTIINPDSEEIISSIDVGDNPNSMQVDAVGNIWVLSGGHTAYDENWAVDAENSTPAQLHFFDNTGAQLGVHTMPELGSASSLEISPDGQTLYYLYGSGIYNLDYLASELSQSPIINGFFYGMAVDPIDGTIIGCTVPDFETSGSIDLYDAMGSATGTHTVGIGPNSATFK